MDSLAWIYDFIMSLPCVQEVALATAFWFFHQHIVMYSMRRLSATYAVLSKGDQLEVAISCCSITHAVISLNTIPVWLYNEELAVEPMYGRMPEYYDRFLIFTVGYFMWDSLVSIYHGLGVPFCAHAVASLGVFWLGMHPFLQHYLGFFLGMFELSTPFYHTRNILGLLGNEKHIVYMIATVCFSITFIVVRIGLGFYVSFTWWRLMYNLLQSGEAHSVAVVLYYMLCNIVIMTLQTIWLKEIVMGAVDLFSASKEVAFKEKHQAFKLD
ncbi:hypothetical protein SARC_08925 [Sphaeroforma arctica JP610]|uniref:TLC domain-containing protein n=1 Tax=Sphaeroforma arctica JP610 TaxID=667725 RepID=A0A0L0FQ53_9EUKA|nr:hypothetical protein SARC_08925 [Sphaeroforma arctica JP610]KNC78651.1 hypothetical protein SARC_08925 [Sphaeroforma arctica JP610]|eukprot:XP_014152553.1 hypothetical protein SARC_08925 [Sphaeroforma arctica JP610]